MLANEYALQIFRGDLTVLGKFYEASRGVGASCKFVCTSLRRSIQEARRRRMEGAIWKKLIVLQDILHLPLARCVRTHYQLSCARSSVDVSLALASLNAMLAVEHGEEEWSRISKSILQLYGDIPHVKVHRRQKKFFSTRSEAHISMGSR